MAMITSDETLKLIEQLLNLPDICVVGVEMTETEMTIHAENAAGYSICRRCGQKATEFYCLGESLRLRHLPIFKRRAFLQLQTQRYRCLHCEDGPTTTGHGDWYDPRSGVTRAFARFLIRELVGGTVSDVSDKHDVSPDVIRGALERYVNAEVDWTRFSSLEVIGLDEISLLKGHGNYVTIVSTRSAAGEIDILAVLKGHDKETVVDFLKKIPAELAATIREACTDLYEGFINAVRETLPDVKVVADRFHVAKQYREAADAARKEEIRELQKVIAREFPEEAECLKGLLPIWRKNQADLTREERKSLDQVLSFSPWLRAVYRQRERLFGIFEGNHTKEAAEAELRQWIKAVRRSKVGCYDKFVGTLEKHLDEITNYFVSRLTSGWVEGLNNKIKVLKRRCYGLRNLPGLFQRIWLDLNGLSAFAN